MYILVYLHIFRLVHIIHSKAGAGEKWWHLQHCSQYWLCGMHEKETGASFWFPKWVRKTFMRVRIIFNCFNYGGIIASQSLCGLDTANNIIVLSSLSTRIWIMNSTHGYSDSTYVLLNKCKTSGAKYATLLP